jgi:hypothetical protein
MDLKTQIQLLSDYEKYRDKTSISSFVEYKKSYKYWSDEEYILHLLGESTELMIYLENNIIYNMNVDNETKKILIHFDYCVDIIVVETFWSLKYGR